MATNKRGEFVYPACGKTASEHHAANQRALPGQPVPHEWVTAGDVLLAGVGLLTSYRCRACGVSLSVPAGTTGETLRAHQQGKGSCAGLRSSLCTVTVEAQEQTQLAGVQR
jgi:hypothetical protein